MTARQKTAYAKAEKLSEKYPFRTYIDLLDSGTPWECFTICKIGCEEPLAMVEVYESKKAFWGERMTTM